MSNQLKPTEDDLLHLETQQEELERLSRYSPTFSAMFYNDMITLLTLVRQAIKTGDTNDLEEWAR